MKLTTILAIICFFVVLGSMFIGMKIIMDEEDIRETIDICGSTLLIMRQGECRIGCTFYMGKLVGYYELKYALENC